MFALRSLSRAIFFLARWRRCDVDVLEKGRRKETEFQYLDRRQPEAKVMLRADRVGDDTWTGINHSSLFSTVIVEELVEGMKRYAVTSGGFLAWCTGGDPERSDNLERRREWILLADPGQGEERGWRENTTKKTASPKTVSSTRIIFRNLPICEVTRRTSRFCSSCTCCRASPWDYVARFPCCCRIEGFPIGNR